MIRKVFTIVIVVCALLFGVLSFFDSDNAFADGPGWIGTGNGNGGWTSTSPNFDPTNTSACYAVDHYRALAYCAGLSWMYYEAVTPTTDDVLFGPYGYVGVNDSGSLAEISGSCSNNGKGGFWHYGINVQGNKKGVPPDPIDEYGVTRYKLGSYTWGHWTSFTKNLAGDYTPHSVPGQNGYKAYHYGYTYYLNDYYSGINWDWNVGDVYQELYDKKGNLVYKTTGEYVTSFNGVYSDYKKACEKKHGVGSSKCTSIGGDVWGFCYWDEDLFGMSAASATNAGENVIVEEVTTGIVSQDSDAVAVADVVDVGETVNLVFKHNVYSVEANKEVWWRASETWLDTSNTKNTGKESGYTIENVEPTVDKTMIGTASIQNNGETLYLPVTDPEPVITTTTPVTLLKGGTYVFCQDLKIAAEEDKLQPGNVDSTPITSRACITLRVEVNYYGMSMAFAENKAGGSSTTATEIVPMESKTVASPDAEITIEYGEGLANKSQTITLTFAHDVYSDSDSGEAYWGIKRQNVPRLAASYYPDDPLHFTSEQENGYFVNESTDFWYCDLYPDSDICNSYYGIAWACQEYGLSDWECNNSYNYILGQIGELSSTNNGKYVITDTTSVTISKGDNGKRYCETLYIARDKDSLSGVQFTSQACVVIKVNTISPTGDSEKTYVKSRIKNSRLSDDDPYGGYRGVENDPVEHDTSGEGGNVVYAKPGDAILWQDEYSPGAQRLSSVGVLYLNGDLVGTHGVEECGGGSYHTLTPMGDAGKWDNKVSITANYPNFIVPGFGLPDGWNRGDSSIKREDPVRVYTIHNTTDEVDKNGNIILDVGNTYDDKIQTEGNTPFTASYTMESDGFGAYCPDTCGYPGHYYSCTVWKETFYHGNYQVFGEYTSYNTEGEQLQSKTYLKIPFNFENTLGFTIRRKEGEESPVYPGETVEVVDPFVSVTPRQNDVVGAKYATEVRDAKVALIAYVSSSNQGKSEPWDVQSTSDDLCGFVDHISWEGFCEEVNRNTKTTLPVKNDTSEEQQTTNGVIYKNDELRNVLGTELKGIYNVFDAKAGDWFCMTLGVYPASSGEDDKNLNSSGSQSWRLYTPECIQIAKKPSFQVWGAGLYTAASVNTEVSEKKNLYKVFGYSASPYSLSPGGETVFGSWDEGSVIAFGNINKFASGAGLGKSGTATKAGLHGKGKIENMFCEYLTPLSFANYGASLLDADGCPSVQVAGNAGIQAGDFNSSANVGTLAEYWDGGIKEDDSETPSEVDDLSNAGNEVLSATSKDIRVVKSDGDVTITGGTHVIWPNMTRIIKAKNITINADIHYNDDASYSSSNELPKVIIYADGSGGDGNINISCNVGRIDAVLLAKGTVNDCYDYMALNTDEDVKPINIAARSKQLIINGTIIASGLTLDRTYGNGMGVSNGGFINSGNEVLDAVNSDMVHTYPGSETPAEIINYDSTILLWGGSMAGAGESNTLTVTYQHELAPRY